MSDLFGNHIVGFPTRRLIYTGIVQFLALAFIRIVRRSQGNRTEIVGNPHILSGNRTKPEDVREAFLRFFYWVLAVSLRSQGLRTGSAPRVYDFFKTIVKVQTISKS